MQPNSGMTLLSNMTNSYKPESPAQKVKAWQKTGIWTFYNSIKCTEKYLYFTVWPMKMRRKQYTEWYCG